MNVLKGWRVRPWLVTMLLVTVLASGQVALAQQRLDMAAERNAVLRDMDRLKDEISRMKIELATLMRPDRLRRVAVRRLDMRPPAPTQVVRW